jgi:hypothetical protein
MNKKIIISSFLILTSLFSFAQEIKPNIYIFLYSQQAAEKIGYCTSHLKDGEHITYTAMSKDPEWSKQYKWSDTQIVGETFEESIQHSVCHKNEPSKIKQLN